MPYRFCVEIGDARRRGDITVGELAETDPVLALPAAPYPATVIVVRTVAANALVSLWGNRCSAPPGLVGGHVQVRWRLGCDTASFHAGGAVVVTRLSRGAMDLVSRLTRLE